MLFRSVDLPTPGSPARRIAAPGTKPPPKTRSNSLTPEVLAFAISKLTSPIGLAASVTEVGTSESFLGAETSSTLPQVWHSPQRPTHLAVVQPHSAQRNGSFAGAFAMEADYFFLVTVTQLSSVMRISEKPKSRSSTGADAILGPQIASGE